MQLFRSLILLHPQRAGTPGLARPAPCAAKRHSVLNSSGPGTGGGAAAARSCLPGRVSVDFADFWSCFHSQCSSQPILKCDLNNTLLLVSPLELKWFHPPPSWKPFLHWPHLRLNKRRSRREPGSLRWQGRERNIRFTHRTLGSRTLAPGRRTISGSQLGPPGRAHAAPTVLGSVVVLN